MPVDVEQRAVIDRELSGLDELELVAEPGDGAARRVWSATWPKLLAVGLFLLVWQTAVWLEWKPSYALAPPSEALPELWDGIRDGTIPEAVGITLRRAFAGFAFALVIGVGLGVAVARSRILRSGVGSLITGLQTMPSVAWFPLALLLFQPGTEGPIMFVVIMGAAPSIANGLIAGIDTVPPLYTRAGRVLGARGVSMWRHVVLPAALPSFLGGLKQGWAFAWRSLMAGELLVVVIGTPSVGFLLEQERQLSNSSGVIALMLVILLIGIVVDAVLFGVVDRAVRRRWGLLQ